MTVRDFALVVVRLFGLWVLFESIGSAEQIFLSTMEHIRLSALYGYSAVMVNVFDFPLRVIIGVLLASKPEIVVNRLPTAKETTLRLSTENLIFVCFSIAGLVFFVKGLVWLTYHVAALVYAHPSATRISKAGILGATCQAGIGLWLLYRSNAIVAVLHRPPRAERTFETTLADGEE